MVWALSMKCIFGQLIYYILEELIVRRLHFEYHSCGLGPEYEMHFWPIDLLHFGRANSEEVAFRVP